MVGQLICGHRVLAFKVITASVPSFVCFEGFSNVATFAYRNPQISMKSATYRLLLLLFVPCSLLELWALGGEGVLRSRRILAGFQPSKTYDARKNYRSFSITTRDFALRPNLCVF
jgi:hypothetical protein